MGRYARGAGGAGKAALKCFVFLECTCPCDWLTATPSLSRVQSGYGHEGYGMFQDILDFIYKLERGRGKGWCLELRGESAK